MRKEGQILGRRPSYSMFVWFSCFWSIFTIYCYLQACAKNEIGVEFSCLASSQPQITPQESAYPTSLPPWSSDTNLTSNTVLKAIMQHSKLPWDGSWCTRLSMNMPWWSALCLLKNLLNSTLWIFVEYLKLTWSYKSSPTPNLPLHQSLPKTKFKPPRR